MTEWPSGRAYDFRSNGHGFESLSGFEILKFENSNINYYNIRFEITNSHDRMAEW